MSIPAPVTPRPAAAVVLLRDRAEGGIAVFMVRRHGTNPFMPNVYVFPGGTLNALDSDIECADGLCAPVPSGSNLSLGEGFYAAAVRECFEEAGVLLARRADAVGFDAALRARLVQYRDDLNQGRIILAALLRTEGLVADTDHMLHWSHWITPERFPRRFDTHFFLAPMPSDQEPIFDPRETTAGVWIRPEDALDRFHSGDFPLVYATERQLEQLRGLSDTRAAVDRFSGRSVRANRPRVIMLDGEERIVLEDED